MSNTAYRSDEVILQARRQDLLEKRWAARADVEILVDLQARQSARRVAGIVSGLITVIGLGAFLLVAVPASERRNRLVSLDPPTADGLLTVALLLIPLITFVIATSGRAFRAVSLRSTLKQLFAPTGDLRADVTRLESSSDLIDLRDRLVARAGASYAAPFAIVAVFAPLVLHFVVFAIFGLIKPSAVGQDILGTFDQWIVMSCGLMALSYLVLLVRVFGFAARASTVDLQDLVRVGSGYGFGTLGLTSLAACVPGAVLFFIPPVISFVTGLALLPAMFAGYGALIRRDRQLIEAAFASAT